MQTSSLPLSLSSPHLRAVCVCACVFVCVRVFLQPNKDFTKWVFACKQEDLLSPLPGTPCAVCDLIWWRQSWDTADIL